MEAAGRQSCEDAPGNTAVGSGTAAQMDWENNLEGLDELFDPLQQSQAELSADVDDSIVIEIQAEPQRSHAELRAAKENAAGQSDRAKPQQSLAELTAAPDRMSSGEKMREGSANNPSSSGETLQEKARAYIRKKKAEAEMKRRLGATRTVYEAINLCTWLHGLWCSCVRGCTDSGTAVYVVALTLVHLCTWRNSGG